ncbi:hypothetical protein GM921_17275 [Pedobacter sp. LMG 31464]|uniref:YcxB-like protein n=1 Tax=Pedobacter planticolens TaxID=2679964 RepID=A0A923IWK6_9SPHI|nr:hypothetical protein [Pedobacter planticolens]MBB2147256.1 hypothetical protein [Pedobacter planticolens]
MNITIERNLEKSIDLAQQDWKNKSKKGLIFLLLIALLGIAMLISESFSGNPNADNFNPTIIIGAILITYALATLRVSFAYKANYFKDKKYKILKHIPYPTSIKLTEELALISNPEFTTTYNWDYFKYYKIVGKNIFISSTQKSIGIVIAIDEISEKEQYDLLSLFNKKGIKKTN